MDPRRGLRHQAFLELAREGRWREAFAEGERILDAGPTLLEVRTLGHPWPGGQPGPRTRQALERETRGKNAAWAWFYLARVLSEPAEARAAADRLRGLSVRRYGWMGYWTARAFFEPGLWERSARELRRALRAAPVNWWAYGTLAEVLVCMGRAREALAQFEPALRVAPKSEQPAVRAWRGTTKLWLGRYKGGFADLDRACAEGAEHAFCWRGAAALLLGRPKDALEDLDEALRRRAGDEEAVIWKAEAWRALGQPRRALAALPPKSPSFWARVNRGLAQAALGRRDEVEREVAALDPGTLARLQEASGLWGADTHEERVRLLEAAVRLGKGFRRDAYQQAAWLR